MPRAPRPLTRRQSLAILAGGAAAARAFAAGAPLAYENIDHFSLTVTDLARSLDFYARIFGNNLRKEDASERFYVRLGPSYLALGQAAPGRRSRYIDHFCLGCQGVWLAPVTQALTSLDIKYTTPPPFGIFFTDPDGIRIQMWTEESWKDVARTTSVVSRPQSGEPVFRIAGVDHLRIAVPDPAKASPYYEKLFGVPVERTADRIWFQAGKSRLALTPTASGEQPSITTASLFAHPFDTAAVRQQLQAAGAIVANASGTVAFQDADGIRFEVRPL